MEIIKNISTIYGEEIFRIKVPMEMQLYQLLLGQSQYVSIETYLSFKKEQKIEIIKQIAEQIKKTKAVFFNVSQ